MSITKLIGMLRGEGVAPAATSADTETVRKIVRQLDEMAPEKARYVAAFAYILSRVARADLDISDEETAQMERLVVGLSGLPEEQAILVVQIAKTQATLFGGTENFLVTQEFRKMATPQEKLALLECLFAVSAADESISNAEDREVRQIASELQLTHQDFINARIIYKDYLAVLKGK
ncbi:MAG: TerB family tellurite resistance protein [Candidatus Korobacteraceae bacterium]